MRVDVIRAVLRVVLDDEHERAVGWFGARLTVSRAGSVFGEGGAIVDPAIREQLSQLLRGFVDFVERTPKPPA